MKILTIALCALVSLSALADCSLTLVEPVKRDLDTDTIVRVLENKGYTVSVTDKRPNDSLAKYLEMKTSTITCVQYAKDANPFMVAIDEILRAKGTATIEHNLTAELVRYQNEIIFGSTGDRRYEKVLRKLIKKHVPACH